MKYGQNYARKIAVFVVGSRANAYVWQVLVGIVRKIESLKNACLFLTFLKIVCNVFTTIFF